MSIPKTQHLMNRRRFLKTGVQTGAMVVSFPLWKHFAGKDADALLAAEAELPAGLDKETLRKLLEVCLSRGGGVRRALLRADRREQHLA